MTANACPSRVNSNALLHSDSVRENISPLLFDKLEWLTTAEAAVYLRKLTASGNPQLNTVHKMVSRGLLRRRKFGGRLYFKRRELDYLIESSPGQKP